MCAGYGGKILCVHIGFVVQIICSENSILFVSQNSFYHGRYEGSRNAEADQTSHDFFHAI